MFSGGILESACLSVRPAIHLFVYVSVCVQNISNFVSQTPPTVLLLLYRRFVDTLIVY